MITSRTRHKSLNHTFNGQSIRKFNFHRENRTQPQHNHNNIINNNNNNTTTLTKTVLITTTTHDDKLNHTIFRLSLHLFCWNLTQHHRPMVLSVSLKTVGCLCKDSMMHNVEALFLLFRIIHRIEHNHNTTTQQQQQHNN